MKLRLTDGNDLNMLSCNRECDPVTNDNILICELSDEYDFNELVEELKKPDISEILTVYEDGGGMLFQSKDYRNVLSINSDIQTKKIVIKFNNKRK